jgi:hypothetical protein
VGCLPSDRERTDLEDGDALSASMSVGSLREVYFQSELITLDDIEAVARVMRILVEITNDELRSQNFDPDLML